MFYIADGVCERRNVQSLCKILDEDALSQLAQEAHVQHPMRWNGQPAALRRLTCLFVRSYHWCCTLQHLRQACYVSDLPAGLSADA